MGEKPNPSCNTPDKIKVETQPPPRCFNRYFVFHNNLDPNRPAVWPQSTCRNPPKERRDSWWSAVWRDQARGCRWTAADWGTRGTSAEHCRLPFRTSAPDCCWWFAPGQRDFPRNGHVKYSMNPYLLGATSF